MKVTKAITVSFNPAKSDLDEIGRWLAEEKKETGEGFKGNWDIIVKAYDRNCMAVLLENNIAVGFAIWYQYEFRARIDIFCIKQSRRKNGLGTILDAAVLYHLKHKEKLAIDLQCEPPESESFWRKEGFVDFPFPEKQSPLHNLWLCKVIVPTADLSVLNVKGTVIALWNVEPYMAKTHHPDPKWTWQINNKVNSDELILPVVFPCQSDWQVQLIRDGNVTESKKAKYFNNGNSYFDRFLIITSLTP